MKVWLIGMSGPDSLANLREMIDPIKEAFAGVVWVLHDAVNSEETQFLESVKGKGKVIYYYYSGRHDVSRNQALWCGPIQEGDWCVDCDDKERIAPSFAHGILLPLIKELEAQNINAAFYYGKHFMFKYHGSLRYQGSPHEGITRDDGQLRAIDLKEWYPKEETVRYGVRNQQRDPFHFVGHYAKYMLMPWGSNHALLGLEERGKPAELFHPREKLRLEFLGEMTKRGFPRTLAGLKDMLSQPLDSTLRHYINHEKVWNDFYRYEVLGDKTVVDEHKWTSMVTFT